MFLDAPACQCGEEFEIRQQTDRLFVCKQQWGEAGFDLDLFDLLERKGKV